MTWEPGMMRLLQPLLDTGGGGSGGGGQIQVPGLSEEERGLITEQTEILRQARELLGGGSEQFAQLQNLLFEEAGVQPVFRPGEEFDTQLADLNAQREGLFTRLDEEIAAVTPATAAPLRIRQNRSRRGGFDIFQGGRVVRTTNSLLDALKISGSLGGGGGGAVSSPVVTSLTGELERLDTQIAELEGTRGEPISFERIFDPLAEQRQGVEAGFLERVLAAQAGDLPVNPALLRQLEESELTLEETLRKQLGPGFETSSPGIERLTAFERFRTEALENARRADLTFAESGALGRRASSQQDVNLFLSRIMGINQGVIPFASGQLGVAQGFSGPIQSFQQQRALETQAAFTNAQLSAQQASSRSGLFGDIFGGLASIGGSFVGGGGSLFGGAGSGATLGSTALSAGSKAAFLSSRLFKTDSEPIDESEVLVKLENLPVESWSYISNGERHIGPYAEDFKEMFGIGDGVTINYLDAIGVLMASVKALSEKVRLLKGSDNAER